MTVMKEVPIELSHTGVPEGSGPLVLSALGLLALGAALLRGSASKAGD